MSIQSGTVYLVDDDPSMCKALMRLVESQKLQARAFGSARDFLEHGPPNRPACLVLDIQMPGLNGLELQTELARQNIDLPIIFITGHGDVRASVRAMKQGAVDFLLKPFNPSDLACVIQQALVKDLRRQEIGAERQELERRLENLTPREREVFLRVIRGFLNKQIADELGASEQTIKVHRHRVMDKMKVQSVAELVQAAVKLGLL
jgi:RNA polymerase sigma factor (sigma-70 family)